MKIMAVSTSSKLVISFVDEEDKNFNVSFANAKADATAAQVKNLADTMLSNAEIFQRPMVSKSGAKMVTTTETDIEIND